MANQSNIRNFCIIAHIDHGKSTLADRFLELTQTVPPAKMYPQYLDSLELEREKQITIKLAPAKMEYKEYSLNLIDTPGHVDFAYEVSRSLAAVEGAILLVDATQGVQAQTLAHLHQAQKEGLTIIPVVNKIDLPSAQMEKAASEIKSLLGSESEIFQISAKTGQGVGEVLAAVVKKIPPPKGNSQGPLRALVFDSVYDAYQGVIAYVRVVDGGLQTGEGIRLIAGDIEAEAAEIGYFQPELRRAERLGAGEIGYIKTGIKDISQVRVGETITLKINDTSQSPAKISALPGYSPPKSMLFAGLYPKAAGGYPLLADSLKKLKLTDASLEFSSQNSPARNASPASHALQGNAGWPSDAGGPTLGPGFQAGFLGMFHLEITKERLRREYGAEAVVTTPHVAYRQLKTWEEPWVGLEIITPKEYLGKVMELTSRSRALYKNTTYLGDRVILEYEGPLAEIIIDFYDRLKDVSSGFASMDYQFLDYRPADLEQLEILVADEKVEAFSRLVHQSKAQSEARRLAEKLKDLIPRQLFEVKIQVIVAGKIIASERIPPLRKDVTAKLYGGDVTRKKKLLERQKRGKKRMERFGRVEIPSDVFLKVL